ncbi:MAG: hypothetical protein HY716_01540 [Planctomycetes bacterium]|nr:hypothetical protein [Planctomycetota bacterium]
MKYQLYALGIFVVSCAASGMQSPSDSRVVSARVTKGPAVDGKADDEAWKTARSVQVTAKGVFPANKDKVTEVVIRSVRTDSHIYFLVRWKDETKDDKAHKPWVWDAAKNAYVEGPEREDMFAVAFEHTGPFDPDMLSGMEAVWDVWQWKATRTNPQGFAMDRTHRYSKEQWQGKGKSHKDRKEQAIWIARPEDMGDTVEKKQTAPAEKKDDVVPQYLPGTPSGSAADVKAKGAWEGGWWTLELERKLDTGNPDDTKFEPGRVYKMAVSAHDHTGDMDKASEVMELEISGK